MCDDGMGGRGGIVNALVPVRLARKMTEGHWETTGRRGRVRGRKKSHQKEQSGDIYNGREKTSGPNNRLLARSMAIKQERN